MTTLKGKFLGNGTIISLDGDIVVSNIGVSMSLSNDGVEATDKDSCGWVERLIGQNRDTSLTLDFNRNDNKVIRNCSTGAPEVVTTGINLIELINYFSGDDGAVLKFLNKDDEEGTLIYEIRVMIESVDIDSNHNEVDTFSVSALQLSKPTISVVPEPAQ